MAKKAQNTLFNADVTKKLNALGMFPTKAPEVERLPTGIYTFDVALNGGYAKRRLTEISGHPHSGKTTTALIAAANVIANGGYVAYIDAERALDIDYVKRFIPEDEIYIGEEGTTEMAETHFHVFRPDILEQALQGLRELLYTNLYTIICFDSLAGVPARAELEGEVGDSFYALMARVLGVVKKVLAKEIAESSAAVLFLTHLTTNIDQKYLDPLLPYGGKFKPAGGQGIGYTYTARIMMYDAKKLPMPEELKKEIKSEIDDETFVYGKTLTGRIWKNKIGVAPRSFSYDLVNYPYLYFHRPKDIVQASNQVGVLEQRVAHWYFHGERLAGSVSEMESIVNDENNPLSLQIEAELKNAIANLSKEEEDDHDDSEQRGLEDESLSLFPEAE